MPDYATPGVGNAFIGYLIAAVVGVMIAAGLAWVIGALLAKRRSAGMELSDPAPPG